MYNLITIGDVVMDTHVIVDDASVECDVDHSNCKLCFDYASKVPISDSFQSLGGNAANVAIGAQKLGMKTMVVTTLGNDSNAQLILTDLKKNNVDTSFVALDKQSKTRYSIVLNFKGERTILSYHQKRKYVWPKMLPACDWVYYTSMSTGFEPFQNSLFDYLDRHQSVRLAFNPGSFQLVNALDTVKEAIYRTDLLIVNLEEAEKILNTTLRKEKNVEALIHEMFLLGAKEVVITDGERGAWAGTVDGIFHQPSHKITVVSKTGAGDAFSAGYISAKIHGHDIATSLKWGVDNSCSVISAFGPHFGQLNKKEIQKSV